MLRKILIGFVVGVFAFGILSVSVLESSSVRYAFNDFSTPTPTASSDGVVSVEYAFTYPGRILPDHPLWPLKAIRDRVWLALATNLGKKAELNLLFADKRLLSAKTLFERKKPELAFSILTGAEEYLQGAYLKEEESRARGADTSEFLIKLSTAALKHREEIDKMLDTAPEDARSRMIQMEDYSKNVYKSSKKALNAFGKDAVNSPFDGE